jgi:hypothetical protein
VLRRPAELVEWDTAPSSVAGVPIMTSRRLWLVAPNSAGAWAGSAHYSATGPTGQSGLVPVRTALVWKLCTPGLEHTVCGALTSSDPVEPGGNIR